eukprot:3493465-Pleurochrysis_carterae.AAC.1
MGESGHRYRRDPTPQDCAIDVISLMKGVHACARRQLTKSRIETSAWARACARARVCVRACARVFVRACARVRVCARVRRRLRHMRHMRVCARARDAVTTP